MTESQFNALCARIEHKIADAESALNRTFSKGELCDLILDNFSEVRDSQHARDIINTMRACGYDI